MEKRRIPELLAPVGGWQQLKAAVQNGADAVYMGGPLFNARMKAENFTHDDMREAILYAHDRDVRVYVTINTLIKDSELQRALSYVNFLYGAGADAVILQDVGLARLVRRYLPEITMHMSTQGTIYNAGGVEWARRFGFSRVVPARELTLEEIKDLAKNCREKGQGCEIEIFVHGAMCMCYSGQCHMSRVIGGVNGRSGNRGLCAQPCRLPYTDDRGKTGYLLSPKDMCAVGMLPEICEAGVDSLKIEGRLKSPQYVAVVTAVYRKYLDMYRESGRADVSGEDMMKLMSIFNRGGSCSGYLAGDPGRGLLSGDSPKNRGVFVGRVAAVRKGGTLVDVRLDESETAQYIKLRESDGNGSALLTIGDGAEIRGRGNAGNVITYMEKVNGGTVRIGDMKGKAEVGDRVYRVTEQRLLKDAERTYAEERRAKVPVKMVFTAVIGKYPLLEMSDGRVSVEVSGGAAAEKAINRPLSAERVSQQLAKLSDTVFRADDITVHMDRDSNIPIAVLNSMRREAAEELLMKRRTAVARRTPLSEGEIADIAAAEELGSERALSEHAGSRRGLYIYTEKSVRNTGMIGKMADAACEKEAGDMLICVPLRLYVKDEIRRALHAEADGKAKIVPYVFGISKGAEDRYVEEHFRDIADIVRDSGIMLGNPGWISRFSGAGVKVYGDHGFNVYNGQSLKAFAEEGVEIRAYSFEAEEFHRGSIPVMVTEHRIGSSYLTDRKGVRYEVMEWYSGDKSLIFTRGSMDGSGKRTFMTYIR